MSTTRQLREIFELCFDEERRWTNWFFSSIARDCDVVALDSTAGETVSAALMQPYGFAYAGTTLPSAYISCVGTRPKERGHGHATHLLADCLTRAHADGMAFAELIPAQPHLFDYYRRAAGFATAFFVEELHYTSLHPFGSGDGRAVEPTFDILHGLEERMGCGVLHSADDFKYILTDLELDRNSFMAAAECGDAKAIAAVVAGDDGVCVRALLADNGEVAETVLAEVRRRVGNKKITVWAPPSQHRRSLDLRPRAMLRIVDAEKVLGALAAASPRLDYTVRLRDRILVDNNGTFRLHRGECSRTDGNGRRPDLDVDATTLAAVLFGAPATGDIFGLASRRPYISMMLD